MRFGSTIDPCLISHACKRRSIPFPSMQSKTATLDFFSPRLFAHAASALWTALACGRFSPSFAPYLSVNTRGLAHGTHSDATPRSGGDPESKDSAFLFSGISSTAYRSRTLGDMLLHHFHQVPGFAVASQTIQPAGKTGYDGNQVIDQFLLQRLLVILAVNHVNCNAVSRICATCRLRSPRAFCSWEDTRPYTASTRADEDPAFPKIRSISVAGIRLFPPMVRTTRSFPSRSHRWMVVRCTPSRLAASPALNIFSMMINYIRK